MELSKPEDISPQYRLEQMMVFLKPDNTSEHGFPTSIHTHHEFPCFMNASALINPQA
jgi:hypothetical protein